MIVGLQTTKEEHCIGTFKLDDTAMCACVRECVHACEFAYVRNMIGRLISISYSRHIISAPMSNVNSNRNMSDILEIHNPNYQYDTAALLEKHKALT